MPQQINLCNPIFLTQKRYFSASTMARSLGVFVLLGGLLSGYWSWTLRSLNAGYQQSVNNNQREITRLQAAIQINRANAAPADAAQLKELQARQTELQQRELLLRELRRGLLREGYGHAARLQLVARSIPPQAWVTEVRADDLRLELSGYTLEPAALNGWVTRLSESPLLEGQQLSVVKVERVKPEQRAAGAAAVPAVSGPLWSYTLVTALPPQAGTGGKP
ncbi:MAG: PilN domain-containing protein [Burkholderiales bacterium]|nr:PilN domain-containing protein [Burkholderiales bacterium]